jgi:hypothetical protein
MEVCAELGGDDQAVPLGALFADVVTDDLLRVTLGVDVGGVDEVAAELDVTIDDRFGLLDAAAPAEVLAEGHGTEAEWAHAQARAAERHIMVERHELLLERRTPLRVSVWR